MLAGLVAFRVQVHRLKHRPVDVAGMQQKVMQSLGLMAATDIGPTEFGITVVFDTPPGVPLSQQFQDELISMLRKAAPIIKTALPGAKITAAATVVAAAAAASTKRVLLVMQKETGRGAASIAETAVEQLLHKAGKPTLSLGQCCIIDANVAVPHRVPREIARSKLTRIKRMGEGAFGEVHQYQLEAHSMSYFVAAKSIKAGAAGAEEARADLLREATLGGLLDHRNVVSTVGICTAPRDVPALLLLGFCPEGNLEELCHHATAESMTVSERLTYCAQVSQGLRYISTRRIVHRDVAARNVLLDATPGRSR